MRAFTGAPDAGRVSQWRAWVASGLLGGAVVSTAVAGQPGTGPVVTFSADIAPILFERCGGCHRPQGAAPFSLLTYAAAKPRATLIAQVTKARLMPPWKSEPGYGEFIGHVAPDRHRDRSHRAMGG